MLEALYQKHNKETEAQQRDFAAVQREEVELKEMTEVFTGNVAAVKRYLKREREQMQDESFVPF